MSAAVVDYWKIRHRKETTSTNADAREGSPGDVFTADFQSAGRGRLAHKWVSPSGANLLMSAVLGVAGLPVETAALLPLVAGLAVLRGIEPFARGRTVQIKWPNDVFVDGKKVCGILCERHGDNVIAGIGVNVRAQKFPDDIRCRATFIGGSATVEAVRDVVLGRLYDYFQKLATEGFSLIYGELSAVDYLKGRAVTVRQTDDDSAPVSGLCGGIAADGSLDVGGVRIYAGEAHVEEVEG